MPICIDWCGMCADSTRLRRPQNERLRSRGLPLVTVPLFHAAWTDSTVARVSRACHAAPIRKPLFFRILNRIGRLLTVLTVCPKPPTPCAVLWRHVRAARLSSPFLPRCRCLPEITRCPPRRCRGLLTSGMPKPSRQRHRYQNEDWQQLSMRAPLQRPSQSSTTACSSGMNGVGLCSTGDLGIRTYTFRLARPLLSASNFPRILSGTGRATQELRELPNRRF